MSLLLQTFLALLCISNVACQPTGISTYVSRTMTLYHGKTCSTKWMPLTLGMVDGVGKIVDDQPISVTGGGSTEFNPMCIQITCENETSYNFSYYSAAGCNYASGPGRDGYGWFTMNQTNGIRMADGECSEAHKHDGADMSIQIWGFEEVLQCGDVDFAPSTRYSALVAAFAAFVCFMSTW